MFHEGWSGVACIVGCMGFVTPTLEVVLCSWGFFLCFATELVPVFSQIMDVCCFVTAGALGCLLSFSLCCLLAKSVHKTAFCKTLERRAPVSACGLSRAVGVHGGSGVETS